MHPKKAELLTTIGEVSRLSDVALGTAIDLVRHPRQYGWRNSLAGALVGLPLLGVSAVIVDVAEVVIARSTDAEWQRAYPDDAEGDDPDRAQRS
jgi:hypothetical protein